MTCRKGGSIPTKRRMSCQRPLGILNTLDEHEAHQAPFRGSMGLPTAEPLIEAEGERRQRKQTKCRRWKKDKRNLRNLRASELPANHLSGTKILHLILPMKLPHHLSEKAAWLPRSSFSLISQLLATPWMLSRRWNIVS